MSRSTRRITIKDIAEKAQVSKATVSFAFNAPWKISEETRDRVLQVAEELNYIPDPLARTLTTKQVGAIGLLLPDPIQEAFKNPYMFEVLQGIGTVCHGEDLSLTILPPVKGLLSHTVRTALVDGIITIGIEPDNEILSLIRKRQIPFVTVDGAGLVGSVNVGIDDKDAAYQLMSHVLDMGHRYIAVVSLKNLHQVLVDSPDGIRSRIIELRLQGVYRAMEERGIRRESHEIQVYPVDASVESTVAVLTPVLTEQHRPSAVVCLSDVAALGVYQICHEQQLNIPHDISVAGFDGIFFGKLLNPPLTTLSQPGYEKGQTAASLVVNLMRGLPCSDLILPVELQVGSSVAPVSLD
ncbi:LacI family DNA-binding transcriptional regulator [Gracilinema caldarium]|uniref:Transcriptional regulator, LacI family n=1 Tax=Gracilinema caldarium (strain ATCC 51460 / DSM 7334 / H1) TaxID=744872 RepID=F8F0V7_GRAC1|nr:LacI family DNA-binding transcriptional regulator [Gracilinema caldarium]AEJ20243.1 transcriptional regulator, LacI family [Gracilinema caldarium DSM 7334]